MITTPKKPTTPKKLSPSTSAVTPVEVLPVPAARHTKRFAGKKDLIKSIQTLTPDMSLKDIERVYTGLVQSVFHMLNTHDQLRLLKFGTFNRRERSARTGRNPKTGTKILIPASVQYSFKVSKLAQGIKLAAAKAPPRTKAVPKNTIAVAAKLTAVAKPLAVKRFPQP